MVHYKDVAPAETVKKIRNILEKIGCSVEEESLSSIEGIYSVHIKIVGTTIFSNGKGKTLELALASGYGELMERLQNMINFRLTSNFVQQLKTCKRKVGPDEVHLTNFEDSRIMTWLEHTPLNTSDKHIESTLHEIEGNYITALPFQSYSGKADIIIPFILLDVMYGSNGMAAGNTKEEALVQGLSEIFERHVTQMVLSMSNGADKLYSEITQYVLETNSWARERVELITSSGYDTHIFDMSTFSNLPVIMTVFINLKTAEYMVNIGSHPVLEIAVERTLTEMLQGRRIEAINGLTSVALNIDDVSAEGNLEGIFVNGEGVYPSNIFDCNVAEPSNVWVDEGKSNSEMLEYCVMKIEQLGSELYYRDVSILGFPTYQLIVPGISETIVSAQSVINYFNFYFAQQKLKRLKALTPNEVHDVLQYLESKPANVLPTMFDIAEVQIPKTMPNILYDITNDLLLAMLNVYAGEYTDAYKHIARYVGYLKEKAAPAEILKYYRLVSWAIAMKSKNISDELIKTRISAFSTPSYAEEVLHDISSDNVLSNIPSMPCCNCSACSLNDICCYEEETKLYEAIMNIAQETNKPKE